MIDRLVNTIADWLVNDPQAAARWIVMMQLLIVSNFLLISLNGWSTQSRIKSITRQLRERGINVWESR